MMEVASDVKIEPDLAALPTDTTTLISAEPISVATVSGMPIISSDTSIDGLLNTTTPLVENVQMVRDGSILSGSGDTQSFLIAADPDGADLILVDASQLLFAQEATSTAAIHDGTNIFKLASQDVSNPLDTSAADTIPTSTYPATLCAPNDCNSVVPVSEQNSLEYVTAENGKNDDENQPPTQKGPYKCEVCQKEFPKLRQLQLHFKLHIEEKPNKCDLCDASFNLESNLLLHKAMHCTSDPTCPECNKKFSRIASLKAHVVLHFKKENLICTECGDEFTTQYKLDKHVAEHGKPMTEKYHCKQCPKVFAEITLMQEHMKMHNKIKASLSCRTKKRNIDCSAFSHKCFACDKTFQKQSQLIRHKRIHTGERPFKCDICSKAFSQKGALQIHIIRHSGKKPHRCEFCSATFSEKGNLRVHIQKAHTLADDTNQSLHRCKKCSCVFKKLGSLHSHMRKHIGNSQNETAETDITFKATQVHGMLHQITEVTTSISSDPNQTKQQIRKIAGKSKLNADILQQASKNSRLVSSKDSEKSKTDKMKKAMLPEATLMTLANTATATVKKRMVHRVDDARGYHCKYCSKKFKRPSDVIRHIRIHTHEKPFKCAQCFRTFAVKSTLTAHMRTHTGVKEFKCEICSKMFSSQGTLKVHHLLHSNTKPFVCNICDKSFRTARYRKSHMLTHSKRIKRSSKAPRTGVNVPDIPLQEPILITDTGFIQPLSKNSNMYNQFINEEQSVERRYKCNVCNQAFKKTNHLKQHLRTHTGEKPFACHQCNRAFVSNGVLKAHMKTHSGVKPYRCEICNSKFTTNGSLRRHMCIHSNKRPYMCPYCQKTFKTSINCKKHMKTHRRELAQGQLLAETVITVVSESPGHEVEMKDDGENAVNKEPENIAGDIIANLEEITTADNQGPGEISLGNQAFSEQDTVLQAGAIDVGVLGGSFVTTSTTLIPEPLVTTSMVSILQSQDICESPDASLVETIVGDLALSATVDSSEQTSQEKTMKDLPIKEEPKDICSLSQNLEKFSPMECINHVKSDWSCTECLQTHTGEKPYKCEQCGRTFVSMAVLRSHIKTHYDTQWFKCPDCKAAFATENSLRRHTVIHDNHKPIQCPHCPERFKTKAPYEQHLFSKHKPEHCSRMENGDTPKLEGEMQSSTITAAPADGKRPWNSVFQLPPQEAAELARHNLGETNSVSDQVLIVSAAQEDRISEIKEENVVLECLPKYANQCNCCPKSFKTPSDLVKHLYIHTGEKPYSCEICKKSFALKAHLGNHVKTHTGRKNFSCYVCYSVFASIRSLKVHLRLHTGEMQSSTISAAPAERKGPQNSVFQLLPQEAEELARHNPGETNSVSEQVIIASAPEENRIIEIKAEPIDEEQLGGSFVTSSTTLIPDPLVTTNMASSLQAQDIYGSPDLSVVKRVPGDLTATVDSSEQTSQEKNIKSISKEAGPKDIFSFIQNLRKLTTMECGNYGKAGWSHITHSGTQEFKCPECNAAFSTKSSLRRHMMIHNLKPFQCSHCPETFRSKALCKEHLFSKHKAEHCSRVENEDTRKLEDEMQSSTISHAPADEKRPRKSLLQLSAQKTAERHIPLETNSLSERVLAASKAEEDGISEIKVDDIDEGSLAELFVTSSTTLLSEPSITFSLASLLQSQDICESPDVSVVKTIPGDLIATVDSSEQTFQEKNMKNLPIKEGRNEIFSCSECPRNFKKSSQLKQHLRIHTGEKPYECIQCGHTFDSMGVLRNHTKTHSNSQEFKCPDCKAAFSSKSSLKRHMVIHENRKPFQCSHCPETFRTKGLYKQHLLSKHKTEHCLRLESGDTPRLEGEMQSSTTSAVPAYSVFQLSPKEAAELARHNPGKTDSVSKQMLIIYTAKKDRISEIKNKNAVIEIESLPKYANQCQCCYKTFKKPSNLVRHIRIHTGEKPYACKICKKSFTENSALKRHIKTHTQGKIFS